MRVGFKPFQLNSQLVRALVVAVCTSAFVISLGFRGIAAPSNEFPPPKIHPLPPTLAQWQDRNNQGDYFSEVTLTPLGYLIWSQFPVKVYIERPTETENRRFQQWVEAVLPTVKEWSVYLPLVVVQEAEKADILIRRSRPPLQASLNRDTGQFDLPRARTAETRYEFYINSQGQLAHRFTIQLSPDQSLNYTTATARHELGHALGIWGHSPLETDVMYFSQVRQSPAISVRDINTLKRIYQQPTSLGWKLSS